MKKKNLLLLFFVLGILVGFQSCSDDDDDVQPNKATEKEVTIDATAYDKWVYFSFETGEIVGETSVEEKKSGLDWDIAFHRWDIRFNCGESGTGEGGALLSEGNVAKTGWDAIIEAPESGYSVDEKLSAIKVYGQPPVTVDVGRSKIITGDTDGTWVVFSHTNGPSYDITNQIFVVKTANGKYAKIWLKQYTNAEKKGGHITMKYSCQSDSSRNLD
ncbi:MAG: hypothetical protein COC06_01410 [Bacteroidales bacterium]|nr:MAG: hypothetical protein COC06_01410 [Bacteroidales bacterium]